MNNDKNNKKVYIVNDDENDRDVAVKLMQGLGYEVDFISSDKIIPEFVLENLQQNPKESPTDTNFACPKNIERFNTLTNREKEVVKYLALGEGYSTNKSVAKKMNISHRTVEEYRAEAMRKMQAVSFKDLITIVIVCKLFKTTSDTEQA